MLAFEVSARNGRRLCIGGVADQDLPLSCIVTNVWGRESGDGRNKNMDRFCVSIHGVRKADSQAEQLWWRPNYEMNVGDEVVVRLVEVDEVPEPTSVARAVRADEVYPTCSFCGATKDDVQGMTYGKSAAICSRCAKKFATTVRGHIDRDDDAR